MQLYERIEHGKRVKYVPHIEPQRLVDGIEQEQLITLLTTLTVSMLISIEKQLPDHSRFARELKNVETAVVRLAKLNAKPLDDDLVQIGVKAWNSALAAMDSGIRRGEFCATKQDRC